MASIQATIRDAIVAKIKADRPTYKIPNIEVEPTFFPQENLENLGEVPKAKVTCMGVGASRDRQLRSTDVVVMTIPVQVAIQQRVNPSDVATIDALLETVEQVMDSLESDYLVTNEDYIWAGTDPLTDEDDLIYSYEQLWTEGVFQSISIFRYTYIKQ